MQAIRDALSRWVRNHLLISRERTQRPEEVHANCICDSYGPGLLIFLTVPTASWKVYHWGTITYTETIPSGRGLTNQDIGRRVYQHLSHRGAVLKPAKAKIHQISCQRIELIALRGKSRETISRSSSMGFAQVSHRVLQVADKQRRTPLRMRCQTNKDPHSPL